MPGWSAAQEAILVGLMSLNIKNPPMPPTLNRRRALFVLSKIDQILAWERDTENQRNGKFVDLGRYLCEIRAGQYWRLENLKSFDEFLERRFPESRRKAYYLMSIHEHLPKPIRRELKQVGWSKAVELVKVARRDPHFESAAWLHKARSLPKQEFEQALDTAALMLGSDKSRGYCLEMICADFLAGAHIENGNPKILLFSMLRFFQFLPAVQRQEFLQQATEAA